MSARKVSREPYRIRRSRREVWTAVAAALAVVFLTAVAVWILAPADDSPPVTSTVTPSVATSLDPSATTLPVITKTTSAAEATTDTTGG